MSRVVAALAEASAPTPEATLDELIVAARREHHLVLQAGSAMIEHAIRAGEALLAAKRLVAHGDWMTVLGQISDKQSLSTLRFYMRLARRQDEVRAAQVTGLRQARELLVGASDTRNDPESRQEAQRLRDAGLTQREIAEQIGVSGGTISRWLNPEAEERYRRRHAARTNQARRLLDRAEKDAMVRKHGGGLSEAYVLVRRALQILERCNGDAEDREVKQAISDAMGRMYRAEDQIVRAVRLNG